MSNERALCCDAPHLIVMTGWSCLQCGNVTLQLTLQILQCQLHCELKCSFLGCGVGLSDVDRGGRFLVAGSGIPSWASMFHVECPQL